MAKKNIETKVTNEPQIIYKCDREKEITELQTDVSDLIHIIKDNGQKGLQTVVTELRVKLDTLIDQMPLITSALNAVAKQQSEYTGEIKYKAIQRQKTAILVSSILSVAGIIVTAIIKLL